MTAGHLVAPVLTLGLVAFMHWPGGDGEHLFFAYVGEPPSWVRDASLMAGAVVAGGVLPLLPSRLRRRRPAP